MEKNWLIFHEKELTGGLRCFTVGGETMNCGVGGRLVIGGSHDWKRRGEDGL